VKKKATVKVALVCPYFHPANDNSIFRLHLLGLGYIAKALKIRGSEVDVVDCTSISSAIEGGEESKDDRLIRHKLLFDSGFIEGNLKDAIGKAQAQFYG